MSEGGRAVAPCIGYSHSYGTLPGTTNIQPSTLTQLLADAEVRKAEPEHGPVRFGVFGDPNKARADAGEVYCEWKIEQFAQFVRELESGPHRLRTQEEL